MEVKYDYLVVGAGLYGSTFAHQAHKRGKRWLVIDKRSHIAGHIYTEKISDGGFVAERLLTLYVIGNNIPRIERRILDASGRDISPGKARQILNGLYFRMFGR